MSAAQIIEELPKLDAAARREILTRLLELDEEQAGLLSCLQAATEGGAAIDAMEAEDGETATR